MFSRRFSLIFFVALQVVIDLESLYHLVKHRYPVHRFLHTFIGAALLAAGSSALVFGAMSWWRSRHVGPRPAQGLYVYVALLATALFATWSHVVLDGIMHRDIRPFWPLSDANPLLSLVGVGMLHLACLVTGFFGLIALAFEWSLRDRDR